MIDLRIGSVLAMVGSILLFVFSILHPSVDATDTEAWARGIAKSAIWVPDHLGLLLGLLLMAWIFVMGVLMWRRAGVVKA